MSHLLHVSCYTSMTTKTPANTACPHASQHKGQIQKGLFPSEIVAARCPKSCWIWPAEGVLRSWAIILRLHVALRSTHTRAASAMKAKSLQPQWWFKQQSRRDVHGSQWTPCISRICSRVLYSCQHLHWLFGLDSFSMDKLFHIEG